MSWIENLLIITGISMDIFASMECQGALVAKVNKKQLIGICVVTAALQLTALLAGNLLVQWYFANNVPDDGQVLGQILAFLIFIGIGIHLIIKAVKNERIVEHREEQIPVKSIAKHLIISEIYVSLAGVAFGFLSTGVVALMVMVVAVSALFIVTGIYTGYHFGFEQKGKAYIIGAALLILAGADVFVRLVANFE
jgi:putative Mn2+ efflux pump MntP